MIKYHRALNNEVANSAMYKIVHLQIVRQHLVALYEQQIEPTSEPHIPGQAIR